MTVYDIIKELGITEGYNSLYGDCKINLDNEAIWTSNKDGVWAVFDKDGKFDKNGECVIFLSKDNRNWEEKLEGNKNKLIPAFTPVMVSDDGENWSVKYYKSRRFCLTNKTSIYGSWYQYIVPVSRFDFEADDLSINIINSI